MKERFINRQEGKNKGRVAYVERRDDVAKTVVLVFEDGNGGTKVSYSTLKRWWKKVEDTENESLDKEVVAEDKPIEQAVVDPDTVASDGTPYTEVMKEIVEDGEKAKKQVKQKKEKKPKIETIPYDDRLHKVQCVVEATGYGIKIVGTLPKFVSIIDETGKQKYGIYLGNKKFSVNMPKARVPEGMVPDRVRNCPFAAAFDISYDNVDSIVNLIKKEEK